MPGHGQGMGSGSDPLQGSRRAAVGRYRGSTHEHTAIVPVDDKLPPV